MSGDANNSGGSKTFGQACQSTNECRSDLYCVTISGRANKCVECDPADQGDETCQVSVGSEYACKNGACVKNGGNDDGERCINGSHCASGNCEANVCREKSGGRNDDGNSGTTSDLPDYTGGIDLTIDDIYNIILAIACRIQQIGFLLAVIAVVWIGYQYIYFSQNPAKLTELKKAFGYVVLGIIIIASVYLIISTIAVNIGVSVDYSFLSCTATDVDVDFGGGDVVPEP